MNELLNANNHHENRTSSTEFTEQRTDLWLLVLPDWATDAMRTGLIPHQKSWCADNGMELSRHIPSAVAKRAAGMNFQFAVGPAECPVLIEAFICPAYILSYTYYVNMNSWRIGKSKIKMFDKQHFIVMRSIINIKPYSTDGWNE